MLPLVRIGLAVNHAYAFYRGVLRGIRRFAETRPHWIFTSQVPEQSHRWSLGGVKPDGLIASVHSPSLAKAVARWRGPVVNVSAVIADLPYPNVRVDNEQVGQLAAEHFLSCGLRHFAFVGHLGQLVSNEREAAFRRALGAGGHALAAYHERRSHWYDFTGRRWPLDRGVQRWLAGLAKPVGVLAQNDLWGVQLAEACRQAGLRVPEDVALLGVDNDDLYCELSRPALSSIVLPTERIGYEAAALLERLLQGASPPQTPLLLQPLGVVARRSTEALVFHDPDVVAAVRLIRDNAHMRLRAADILQELAAGRRTLERRFRAALGHGIGAEIRRVHLERAKRLLAETQLSMKAIAHESGFTDFRHMNVVFRQELGVSPSAYRKGVTRTPRSRVPVV